MKKWDEREKETRGLQVEKIQSTKREKNLEKFMKLEMQNHQAGTYYPESYLKEVRKLFQSQSGRIGDTKKYDPNIKSEWDEV